MTEETAGAVDVSTTDAAPTDAAPQTEATADIPTEVADAPESPSFDWSDMRAQLSGGDEKLDKVFGRYRSADAFAKAFMAQRQKLSEKASAPTLGEDATDEDLAAYREFHGIPATVDEYEVSFGEGFEFGDADTAVLDDFKTYAHEHNLPPTQAQAVVDWFQGMQEAQRQEMNAMAETVHQESSDALTAEWGKEFEANQNAIKSYLNDTLGAEQAEALRSARLEDGSRLMDNADVLRLLVNPAVDYIGGDMMIAGDKATAAKSLNDRLSDLMALRLSDPNKYKSDEVQAEVTGIYKKLERMG